MRYFRNRLFVRDFGTGSCSGDSFFAGLVDPYHHLVPCHPLWYDSPAGDYSAGWISGVFCSLGLPSGPGACLGLEPCLGPAPCSPVSGFFRNAFDSGCRLVLAGFCADRPCCPLAGWVHLAGGSGSGPWDGSSSFQTRIRGMPSSASRGIFVGLSGETSFVFCRRP